jgi:hypothetical protein
MSLQAKVMSVAYLSSYPNNRWQGEQRDSAMLRHHEKTIRSKINRSWCKRIGTWSLISGASTTMDGM